MKRSYTLVSIAKVLSCIFFLLFISCAIDPVSGDRQLMLMSESEEIQLGRKTDRQVVRVYGMYDDPNLNAYCNELLQKLAKLSHRPNLYYQFKILDSASVNAFAAPGGFVYFTRGILAYMNSEAELAGILGHELGHITARHAAEQYTRAQLAQIGLGPGSIFSPTPGDLPGAAQLGTQLLFLRFSRDNEREADDLGVEYSSKANYDASKLSSFFETLDRMDSIPDRSGLPDWFSTHPNPEDRQEAVRRKAVEWQQKLGVSNLKVNRNIYLRKIDGLVFGDDSREGFVENNIFYHPELAFQFPVPAQWILQNTHAMVRMVSARKDAGIMFSITQRETPEEAARTFSRQNEAMVLNSRNHPVSGYPAHLLLSKLRTKEGMVKILSCFIQKQGFIYVFHGTTSEKLYPEYQSVFSTIMNGFSELKDPDKLNIRNSAIRVRSAPLTGELRKVLIALGTSRFNLAKLAVLNGKNLHDNILKDTLIKTIEP